MSRGSVASGLANDVEGTFGEKLEYWFTVLKDKFATFMCDSVASRLAKGDKAFHDMLEYWRDELGTKSFVALMSRNGVAKLFLDDAFQNEMEYWRDKLGRDKRKNLRFAKLTPAMLTRLTTQKNFFDDWLKEVQDLSKTKDEGLSSFVTLFSRGSFVKAIAENEEWNKNAQSKMSFLGVKEFTKQCRSKKAADLREWLATSGL